MNIGIFGATGLVGQEFLKLLENKNKMRKNIPRNENRPGIKKNEIDMVNTKKALTIFF